MNKLLLAIPVLLVLVVPLAIADNHDIPRDQPEEPESDYEYREPTVIEPERESDTEPVENPLEVENDQLKEEILNLKIENEQLILQNISLQDEIESLKDQIVSMTGEFMENIVKANEWFRSQLN